MSNIAILAQEPYFCGDIVNYLLYLGYGFMGRTHSNAFKRVGDFFPELAYRPVLKAVCARNEERVRAFAEQWGYESVETDWKKLIAIQTMLL